MFVSVLCMYVCMYACICCLSYKNTQCVVYIHMCVCMYTQTTCIHTHIQLTGMFQSAEPDPPCTQHMPSFFDPVTNLTRNSVKKCSTKLMY
jgi:hypothetical protein